MEKNKRSKQHTRVRRFINKLRFPDERPVAGGIFLQKGIRKGSRGGKGADIGSQNATCLNHHSRANGHLSYHLCSPCQCSAT